MVGGLTRNVLELAVVMPVYNEDEIIETVVRSWVEVLEKLSSSWQLHLYDDGSVDASLRVIKKLAEADERLVVHHHDNKGHGPTVIGAYQELGEAEWIFQTDADNEIKAENFAKLWEQREENDFLVGERVYGKRPWSRIAVSAGSRWLVWGLYGRGVHDVNAPFRMMRAAKFRDLFGRMPADFFSPNLLITGTAIKNGMRIFRTPVPYRFRQTGVVSIRKGKLLKAALKSLWQTIWFVLGRR